MTKPSVVIAAPQQSVVLPPQVFDPDRLLAVTLTGLMDTGPDAELDDLSALAASVTGASRAFVTLVDAHRSFWKSVVAVPEGAEPGASALPVDLAVRQNPAADSPCHILVATGCELVSPDAAADPRISGLAAVRGLGIGAWAGYPIRSSSGQVLGGLCVVDDHARPWTAAQMRGLATLARAVSSSIAVHQELDRAQLEIIRLELSGERSQVLARSLQDSLLPPVLTCPPWLDAAAVYLAANDATRAGEVIGDFFDLFHTRNTWWCAVVGDVCGHGLEAAKVTALARYTIRAEATQHTFPAKVLNRLNQAMILQKVSDRFLTAACVAIRPTDPDDPAAGAQGMISLGGHPAALLRRADGTVTQIGRPGMVLGVMPEIEPATDGFELGPGDLVLLYTDGASEARNPAGELLLEEGLAGLLAGIDATDAEQVLTDLLTALTDYTGATPDGTPEFRSDDDTALLVLRLPQPATAAAGGEQAHAG